MSSANSDSMRVVLSPSCWSPGPGAAANAESSDRCVTPRLLRGRTASPTFQSSLPFGPNNSAPERAFKVAVSGIQSPNSRCGPLPQRRHLQAEDEPSLFRETNNILPQERQTARDSMGKRSKSDECFGASASRSRHQLRHFRQEIKGNLLEEIDATALSKTPRAKTVVPKEPDFFNMPADNSVNRRFRPWAANQAACLQYNCAVVRGRSAPAAIGVAVEAMVEVAVAGRPSEKQLGLTPREIEGDCQSGQSPARSRSQPRQSARRTATPILGRSGRAATPRSLGSGPATPGRITSAPATPARATSSADVAAPLCVAEDALLQPATPRAITSAALPQSPRGRGASTPDKPGGVWGTGCRNGAALGVPQRTATTPKSVMSPGDDFLAPYTPTVKRSSSAPRSPMHARFAEVCGGPSSPRGATPKAASSPAGASPNSKSNPQLAAYTGANATHTTAPTVAPVPRGKEYSMVTSHALSEAPPHLNGSQMTLCLNRPEHLPTPKMREQPHLASALVKQVVTQDQTPLPCGEEERSPSGVVWKHLSARAQLIIQKKQAHLQGHLHGPGIVNGGDAECEQGSTRRDSPIRAPMKMPYGTQSDLPDDPSSPNKSPGQDRHQTTCDGGLYLEAQNRATAQKIKGDLGGHLTFPESSDYASALRTLSPADLRAFSKRLQESNQKVKGELHAVSVAEKRERQRMRQLFSRNDQPGRSYDAQTGRPLSMPAGSRRPVSSGDSHGIGVRSPKGLSFTSQVRITAPDHHMSWSASSKTRDDARSTPTTSMGTLTPGNTSMSN